MALNYIWIAFFLIAFIIALFRLIFLGDAEIFPQLVEVTFERAKASVDISIYLIGVMTLWLGIMRIGEKGGAIRILSRLFGPLFSKLFPELPDKHPAVGSMIMNISANMLGLDNAATPLGLKAMTDLQEVNPSKNKASNAQIMFLVLNTSGLTLIPISIMALRAANGAANPSDVFLPILLATFFSTLAGLIAVSVVQRINLFNKTILAYLGSATALIIGLIIYFSHLSPDVAEKVSKVSGNLIIFSIIIAFLLLAFRKKVNVYEAFIEGAKDGFGVAIKIIPYLVAMLVAIGVFRTSGALDYLTNGIGAFFAFLGVNTDFVDALPTAFMKPLSGSGARGMMVDTMIAHGADSFVGRLSGVFQGSTETTFYVLAVYFGAVNIKHTRHTLGCALFADLIGVIAAIFIAYIFFH
jgi:spore maturation protein SpmA